MNYKNAFRCKKCPQSNGPDGCPVWTEIAMVNNDGQTKIDKQCGFQHMPMLMVEVIKAANRPAGEISEMRSEMSSQYRAVLEGSVAAMGEEIVKRLQ